MKKPNVDDYLQEGIYGSRQTKPAERKRYLGTLRERVVLVLTKGQVMQKAGLNELSQAMKEYKDAKLLLNGKVSYRFRKPYRKVADQNRIRHTTVSNQDAETDLGAILTVDYAIEKDEVELKTPEKSESESSKEGGLTGFIKSLFKPVK
ncbi:YueI family protein [Halobacillus sp. Marseille-Q1614]|uniref:YueI family protein n=1 Tax=Halobacillus sp. Marseille-Q1614 TaxID=2709134 RepID=UPI00156F2DCD|nr:YueI family protein [Halobacillus sp. Marseille-Q1614]